MSPPVRGDYDGRVPAPVTLAAIDAGSNAIRAIVAVASSTTRIEPIVTERAPIRLGHLAFTRGTLDPAVVDEAVAAFARFRRLFDDHGVQRFRAVATSATREAKNRDLLLRRVDHEAGIELEVIDGEEEARLGRKAIAHAFRERRSPNLVLDLGGGSLEIDVRRAAAWDTASLPLGTVRLVESFGIAGRIGAEDARVIRRHASTLVGSFVATSIETPLVPAAAAGGNAEALAQLLGKTDQGMPCIDTDDLEAELPRLLGASVEERMKLYSVKQDRAEVMAVAALVLASVARELNLRRYLVPGVGIREGILLDLAEETGLGAVGRELMLLAAARAFAGRVSHDTAHGEHVRKIARSLFDQLHPVHELPESASIVLELAALLHDVGEIVHRRGHHRHGEYILRWARIPGLEAAERDMVATLVRTHRKASPDPKKHEAYAALGKDQQRHARKLAALLRLADAFDSDRRQRVRDVRATTTDSTVTLEVVVDGPSAGMADRFARKADLFEKELGRRLRCEVTSSGGAS